MFKKTLSIILASFAVFPVAILAACAESASNVHTYVIDASYTEYVVMGTSADYPPYEWPLEVDGKTTIVGLDIEIAKYIAAALGKNLKVVNKNFDFLIEDLEAGKVDFVMAGMTPTEARALWVDFSPVYYESIQVVLVLIRDADVAPYASAAALNIASVKVGAQLGATSRNSPRRRSRLPSDSTSSRSRTSSSA